MWIKILGYKLRINAMETKISYDTMTNLIFVQIWPQEDALPVTGTLLTWKLQHFEFFDKTLMSLLGPSRVSHEELPLLHRDVQRLEDLCINHISHRLPGHQSPLTSLGMLPLGLCDKIMTHLMKIKALTPKAMQAFISW